MRKDSREVALKILYSINLDCEWDSQEEIYDYNKLNEQDKQFCSSLVDTVIKNQEELLQELSQISNNYSVERMFSIDKIVLLLAMAELKFFDDIPPLVTIKEAMEIVKKYSSEDSVTFVNGILGAYKTKLEK